ICSSWSSAAQLPKCSCDRRGTHCAVSRNGSNEWSNSAVRRRLHNLEQSMPCFSHGGHALMTRRVLVAAAAVTLAFPLTAPRVAFAQTDATYKAKRDQLSKELEETQKALTDAKGQRVQLQARLESLIAQAMQERTQALLLSNEQTALQQLDALLSTSQTNLTAQRDRFAALSDAIGSRTGATLVVLLRADSSLAQTVQSAVVSVDSVSGQSRTYSGQASSALLRGAVDELYRS